MKEYFQFPSLSSPQPLKRESHIISSTHRYKTFSALSHPCFCLNTHYLRWRVFVSALIDGFTPLCFCYYCCCVTTSNSLATPPRSRYSNPPGSGEFHFTIFRRGWQTDDEGQNCENRNKSEFEMSNLFLKSKSVYFRCAHTFSSPL